MIVCFWWQIASINGWEGQRRSLFNERRSEQLASLIEVEQQNPLTITSGKVDNDLDKWLSRQFLQEGERLKNLMTKLWSAYKKQSSFKSKIGRAHV